MTNNRPDPDKNPVGWHHHYGCDYTAHRLSKVCVRNDGTVLGMPYYAPDKEDE